MSHALPWWLSHPMMFHMRHLDNQLSLGSNQVVDPGGADESCCVGAQPLPVSTWLLLLFHQLLQPAVRSIVSQTFWPG